MLEPPEGGSLENQAHTWRADCRCQRLCRRPCNLCGYNTAVRFKLYCKLCETEVAACWKDASTNGWMADFKSKQGSPESFRDMVHAFSQQCPPNDNGRVRKRQKFNHIKAFRLQPGSSDAAVHETAMSTAVDTTAIRSRTDSLHLDSCVQNELMKRFTCEFLPCHEIPQVPKHHQTR